MWRPKYLRLLPRRPQNTHLLGEGILRDFNRRQVWSADLNSDPEKGFCIQNMSGFASQIRLSTKRYCLFCLICTMHYFWGSSTLPIPSNWMEWIWANTWHSLWLEEPLGTEDQHCLYSQVRCLQLRQHTLKPSRLVIIWPNGFQQRSYEIFFGCTQNRKADSHLHLSPKQEVYSPLSQRACVGGLSISDNIKKIHNSQCGTQMLNIPSLISACKSL